MLASDKTSSPHFNAYYRNNSILIQLVITEFMIAHKLTSPIKALTNKILESKDGTIETALIKELIALLQRLLGATSSDFVASRWTKGPLTKLKDYSEQFSHNDEHPHECGLHFYTVVQRAWASALYHLELLRPLYRSERIIMTSVLFLSIKRGLNQLNRRLNAIQKYLPPLIKGFRKNENVIFFLLRQKETLAKIYGQNFMLKFFEEDIHTQLDLLKSLRQRCVHQGLEHLLPSIDL